MSISSVEGISSLFASKESPLVSSAELVDKNNSDLLVSFKHNLTEINEQILSAENAIKENSVDKGGSLPELMIELQYAKMNLTLLVEVRNKILESYQEIMRMQI